MLSGHLVEAELVVLSFVIVQGPFIGGDGRAFHEVRRADGLDDTGLAKRAVADVRVARMMQERTFPEAIPVSGSLLKKSSSPSAEKDSAYSRSSVLMRASTRRASALTRGLGVS
jgi:hypothetical protein